MGKTLRLTRDGVVEVSEALADIIRVVVEN